jgi:hypothetical protein
MTCRYLPKVDTYNRLMYVLQVFISQGMYVMLDYQVMNPTFVLTNPMKLLALTDTFLLQHTAC